MFIVLHCGGIAFNGDTINHRSLGGSETAAYHLAKELARMGHRVRLFTNCAAEPVEGHPEIPVEGEWDGVRYVSAGQASERYPLGDRFHLYATNTPHDVLIAQRHPLALRDKFASKLCFLWLHDLVLARNKPAYDAGFWQTHGAFVVSEYHKAQVEKVLNVLPRVVLPITNGVDPARFAAANADVGRATRTAARNGAKVEGDKIPALPDGEFAMLYSSRPERGLENLVRKGGIMDQLLERAPNAHLYVCGYEHDVPDMRAYYAGLANAARQLPNVTMVGHLTQAELASVMKSCQLHIYPTSFEEVSCITAMECMHAGLPMLASRHAALPETCKGAGTILVDLKDGAVDVDTFVTHVSRLAKRGTESQEHQDLVTRQLKAAGKYTWEATARQVMSHVEDRLAKASSSKPAVLRHLVRHSDVRTARHMVDLATGRGEKWLNHPIAQRCLEEMKLYAFADDPALYAKHYADGCAKFYDGPDFKGPEDCSGHPRFECTADWVKRAAAARAPGLDRRLVLVDVGCAHGHYTVGLARRNPDVDFLGLDVSSRAVDEARKAALAAGVTNCRFEVVDGVDWSAALNGKRADIVLMGEVLEHVMEPEAWCQNVLEQLAAPGSAVVFTTPVGPWEEISYLREHPTRFHVQHFEVADLHEAFGKFAKFDLVLTISQQLPSGDFIGNYVGTFDWDGGLIGKIDLARKLRETVPRETVTLGMIVRDGGATLRKTLEALVDSVDEVVIGVDSTTKDDTEAVVAGVQAKRPLWPLFKVQRIQPALQTGFDAARNATLEMASGDWFLWVDADEDFVRAQVMLRYLRQNCFNGYAIAQHHFAVEPLGVLMTDMPSRLFRISSGAQFLGRVHEHPEIGDNQGVGPVMLMPGVHIAHHGYYTEEIRRGRFQRNIALMMRDRKENPKRKLGKFLWVRDLSHMIQFTIEQTGGALNEQLQAQLQGWAKEAILLFQELLQDGDLRIITDSLGYYSNAVRFLGGGFEMAVRMDVQRGAAADSNRVQEVRCTFADRSHAERLTDLLLKRQLDQFDTRYW